MTRTWIAIAAAACLHASVVSAQVTHFTVNTASASVYKAPTVASPVIGQAAPGATLEVTRDVGSWVKVAWSKSPDGVGYIRKTAGKMSVLGPAVPQSAPATTVAASTLPAATSSAANSAAASQPASVSGSRASSAQVAPGVRTQPGPVPAGYVATPSHRFGLGGQLGGAAAGAGFSARAWSGGQRLGFQFDVARYSMSNALFFNQMTATQVGPKVLYAMKDRVSDRTWLRPYVGAGAHVLRSTLSDPVSGVAQSDTSVAAQFFGGTEVTLSNVPRLGLSADLGYQWYKNPFGGYALNGMTLTASAHWYLK